MANFNPNPVDNQDNHGQELPPEGGLNPVTEHNADGSEKSEEKAARDAEDAADQRNAAKEKELDKQRPGSPEYEAEHAGEDPAPKRTGSQGEKIEA